MRLLRNIVVVTATILALSSCNRDPNVAKKRYLESGNKYFERGNYKAAILMYRDALQKDKKYGEAHYRLGLVYLKQNAIQEAVRSMLRAVEFLPESDPNHWDALVRVSRIYVTAGARNKVLLDDVQRYSEQILKHDPNSFE